MTGNIQRQNKIFHSRGDLMYRIWWRFLLCTNTSVLTLDSQSTSSVKRLRFDVMKNDPKTVYDLDPMPDPDQMFYNGGFPPSRSVTPSRCESCLPNYLKIRSFIPAVSCPLDLPMYLLLQLHCHLQSIPGVSLSNADALLNETGELD